MTVPALIVMAAGVGSRYGGLKQIDPLGPRGESILEYSLYDAMRAGFRKITFVVSKAVEQAVRSRVEAAIGRTCEVAFVVQDLNDLPAPYLVPSERQKPWGTGHAVLSCRHEISSPFGVVNADDFYGRGSFQALYDFLAGVTDLEGSPSFCLVGYLLGNTLSEHGYVARGICELDADGFLLGVDERTHIERTGGVIGWTDDGENWTEISADTTASMNMWGFTPQVFTELDARFSVFLETRDAELLEAEFMLPDVINSLLEDNKATVRVLPTDERWFGVTYQADRKWASRSISGLVREGVYPEKLWE
ncbi:MAG: nucleotidyltransferase [Anaerolineae bacterium]|nr:MAG: nucleotidyltransferase [Anaerolineae bacterium]